MPGHDRRELVAVFAGGALGTAARAAVAEALPRAADAPGLPWATLVVNVAGAFLLGVVAVRAAGRRRALLGTGFCGALTTFSALQLELFALIDRGRPVTAAAYAALSLGAGLVAVAAGRRVARA